MSFLPASRIMINYRHMSELFAERPDLSGIISCVRQVVKVRHALVRHLGQRYRSLRVMKRGGSQNRTHRDISVSTVSMQLVTVPASFVSLTNTVRHTFCLWI